MSESSESLISGQGAQASKGNTLNRRFGNMVKVILVVMLAGHIAQCARGETYILPLNRTNGWQFLNYRKIPPNNFRASPAGLEIGVTNSAAPAVFPLPHPLQVTELRASGRISGSLKVPPGKQGEKGFDDYAVRVGLVAAGSRTLSWREKFVAVDWVKKLFSLAPRGTGISKIHFFNVGSDPKQVGRSRTHPLSELMQETVVAVPDADGRFAFTNRFTKPVSILAVWIACDGDDTKSSFAVTLGKVELETQSTPANK
jgi:hypothetical protein